MTDLPELTDRDRQRIAVHEAAHAVAALVSPNTELIQATIDPDDERDLGGYVTTRDHIDSTLNQGRGHASFIGIALPSLVRVLAGPVAETRFELTRDPGADFDPESYDPGELLDEISDRLGQDYGKDADDQRVQRWLAVMLDGNEDEVWAVRWWLLHRTVRMVWAWWPAVEAVAAALVDRTTLTGEEVKAIARPYLPDVDLAD